MSDVAPEAGVVELPPMNDDQLLDFSQGMRRQLASSLTKGGTVMPTDPKDQQTLLATLDSLDKQIINKKRIQVQEASNEVDRLVGLTMAKFYTELGSVNPLERPVIEGEVVAVPEPDTKLLPRAELVPGETDTSVSTLTYDEFMAANGGV